MLDNFSPSLLVVIVKKVGILVIKVEISQVYKLINYLNTLESDFILQLCSYHIVKVLKAWLIKKKLS